MAQKVEVRNIEEEGILIEKFVKNAVAAWEKDGEKHPATEEKKIFKIVSGQKCDTLKGYKNAAMLEYAVSDELFDKATYGQKMTVMYDVTSYGYKNLVCDILEE